MNFTKSRDICIVSSRDAQQLWSELMLKPGLTMILFVVVLITMNVDEV